MSIYSKKKSNWDSTFKLLTFSFPQAVRQGHYYHRRKYRMKLVYEADGKIKQKYIYFGLKGISNKVDGKQDQTRRVIRKDLFHPYFWQNALLNTKDTLQQAFELAKQNLLKI